MMHMCRELFPTILEEEGKLLKLLTTNFEPSHFLSQDILQHFYKDNFKNYIYSLISEEKDEKEIITKTPEELLSDAGYDLYECDTEKEIQSFKKYYAKGEELCTFRGGRLDSCRVFFAVKKNVNEIKRKDFKNPERQDEYGTSVISIQFTKDDTHTLSIKNRYNHTVVNPDATFSNNLDNIVPGLTASFEKYYGIVQKNKNNNFELPEYVKANDGKWYKYNYEINNTYYCPNNIIIDNFEVKRFEKEKYIIFDYFILDKVNKIIYSYDSLFYDDFPFTIKDIQKIEEKNILDKKEIKIFTKAEEPITIMLDSRGCIISLINNCIQEINDYFFRLNKTLENLEMKKLKKVGDNFIDHNTKLNNINLPLLEEVGRSFLFKNSSIINLDLPSLRMINENFMYNAYYLENLNVPNLEKIGNGFLRNDTKMKRLDLPKVVEIGSDFLWYNRELEELNAPNLEIVKDSFCAWNRAMKKIDLPKLKSVSSHFFDRNTELHEINMPNLEYVGSYFFGNNLKLTSLTLPNLKRIDDNFLDQNIMLKKFKADNLETIGNYFCHNNAKLLYLEFPSLKRIGMNFLYYNKLLMKFSAPNFEIVGPNFCHHNLLLTRLELPKLECVHERFLYSNYILHKFDAESLERVGMSFCYNNIALQTLNLPKLSSIDSFFLNNNLKQNRRFKQNRH